MSEAKKNKAIYAESVALVKKDFPEFWNQESGVNVESRTNTIDTYYKARMFLEEKLEEARVSGAHHRMHVIDSMDQIKCAFKFVLIQQKLDAQRALITQLTESNKALEKRLSALESPRTRSRPVGDGEPAPKKTKVQ